MRLRSLSSSKCLKPHAHAKFLLIFLLGLALVTPIARANPGKIPDVCNGPNNLPSLCQTIHVTIMTIVETCQTVNQNDDPGLKSCAPDVFDLVIEEKLFLMQTTDDALAPAHAIVDPLLP